MKILVRSLDYDGCFAPLSKSDDIIVVNQGLLNEEKENYRTKEFNKAYTLIGSNRQSNLIDKLNSGSKQNGSCFTAIKQINDYLGAEFVSLLMADIDNDLSDGTSYSRATDVDYTGEHADWAFDRSKVRLLFAQMHHIANCHPDDEIVFDFYDDIIDEILDLLKKFYVAHSDLIPSNVTLNLKLYRGGNFKRYGEEPCWMTIQGTGFIDEKYKQTAKDLAHLAHLAQSGHSTNAFDVNKEVNVANNANPLLLINRRALTVKKLSGPVEASNQQLTASNLLSLSQESNSTSVKNSLTTVNAQKIYPGDVTLEDVNSDLDCSSNEGDDNDSVLDFILNECDGNKDDLPEKDNLVENLLDPFVTQQEFTNKPKTPKALTRNVGFHKPYPIKEVSITKEALRETLNKYKTTNWFYTYFLCCFGFSNRRNGTIIALFNLIETEENKNKTHFTKQNIQEAILSKSNDDRHSLHRVALFSATRNEKANGTATDKVLVELREAFQRSQ